MKTDGKIKYLSGFGNEHETEAMENALPRGQFNPQKHPIGLYTEQFSTTAFTAPKEKNRRTWFYRIQPSVIQASFSSLDGSSLIGKKYSTSPDKESLPVPNPLRWNPFPAAKDAHDFIESFFTLATNGNALLHLGIGIHLYHANRSMGQRYFYNADGELLIVPQKGTIDVYTECGLLQVKVGEIIVIPRGMKFKIDLCEDQAAGYICENYGSPLELPERGPIGANGLANRRDFKYPVAHYDDSKIAGELVCKFGGHFYKSTISSSPLDVVAWLGNSAPYKYDLTNFNAINSVSFDHCDPSIFTVLTSPSSDMGIANFDFVIFPPRWSVAENTFRPPWFHRNVMSEFMGLIYGTYDAKEHGFSPGGASLHNCMTPHGPDTEAFTNATTKNLSPEKLENTLAFMFESRYPMIPTQQALLSPHLQQDYLDCWKDIPRNFSPNGKGSEKP